MVSAQDRSDEALPTTRQQAWPCEIVDGAPRKLCDRQLSPIVQTFWPQSGLAGTTKPCIIEAGALHSRLILLSLFSLPIDYAPD